MKGHYLAPGASGKALTDFFARSREHGSCIQGIVVWKDGGIMAKAAPAPYDTEDRGEVYSLSKAFCSTAVGMLIDEGRLTLDTRISDIFPEAAEDAEENIKQATVEDLLTMRTGHAACVMPAVCRAVDALTAFFAQPTQYEHGTRFAYNTAATYMLSATVQKITGMTVFDYMQPRFFEPLGIEGAWWNTCNGVNEGGIGLHVSVEDIWKLGVLYLQNGMWEGKRLLSEEYVRAAQQPHADNSFNGTPDWCAGYGYQFWHNARCGYRGDGAYGQLCMVLPEKNAVVAVRGIVADMQLEVDDVMQLVDEINGEDGEVVIEDHTAPACEDAVPDICGLYRCRANAFGWTQIRVSDAENVIRIAVQDGASRQIISAGRGEWLENELNAKRYCPKLVGIMDNNYYERMRFAAAYTVTDGRLDIVCRYHTNPHIEHMLIEKTADGMEINWTPKDNRGKDGNRLIAVKMP